MPEPNLIFEQLGRRAHAMRALLFAAIGSACGSVILLIVASIAAIVSHPMAHFNLIAPLALAVLCAASYLTGLKWSFPLTTILIRADSALGLEARLSTLHDVDSHPELQLFAKRIEAHLPELSSAPRDAFPVRLREIGLLAAALILTVGALAIANIPEMPASPQDTMASGEVLTTIVETPDVQHAQETSPESLASQGDGTDDEQQVSSDTDSAETLTLGDILTAIRPSPTVITDPDETDADAAIRPRQLSELSLEEVLRGIEQRLRDDTAQTLSASELATLEAYRASAQGEIAQKLESLLASSSHDEAVTRVAQMLADPDLVEATPQTSLPGAEDEPATVARIGPDTGGSETSSLMLEPSEEDDGKLTFVETVVPSASGGEGDYTYYLTKGVPIEPPSQGVALSYQDLDLSYQAIESIVASRSLPSDVLDTIKAYFDRIAGGGS